MVFEVPWVYLASHRSSCPISAVNYPAFQENNNNKKNYR